MAQLMVRNLPEELVKALKQRAATALIYDLTVATRNISHYEPTGVRLFNPFS